MKYLKKPVVLLSGCFDTFHKGHQSIINQALSYVQEGTIIVALMRDASVKKEKGKNRPYINLENRASDIQTYVDCWCKKHLEYPKLKIVPFSNRSELTKIVEKEKPGLVIKGECHSNDIEYCIPTLIVPRTQNP